MGNNPEKNQKQISVIIPRQKPNYDLNIILFGDAFVGKTSLTSQYCEQYFSEHVFLGSHEDHKIKIIENNDYHVKLKIFDGRNKGRRLYDGYIIVYDITLLDSFKNAMNWYRDIDRVDCDPDHLKVLVGNKCDLFLERYVSFEEGDTLARDNGWMFMETSAKLGTNVNRLFEETVFNIIKTKDPLLY